MVKDYWLPSLCRKWLWCWNFLILLIVKTDRTGYRGKVRNEPSVMTCQPVKHLADPDGEQKKSLFFPGTFADSYFYLIAQEF